MMNLATSVAKAPMIYNVALYVRVSTNKDDQADSPENQIDIGREVAFRRSSEVGEIWNTPDHLVYRDTGTGTLLISRPDVQRMIKDAESGRFNIVIFKSISRFARDTEDALHMLRRLLAAGVRVISHAENYDSKDGNEFIFTIHAGLAQQTSEKISIDVKLGNIARARRGLWNGRAPDGYRVDKDSQRLQIVDDRAHVIKRIFELFTVEHLGTTYLVQRMNEDGYRTINGGMFTRKSILNILRNRAYVGDVIYGKRKKEVYYGDDNRRRKRLRIDPKEQYLVIVENAHPSIIHREQFDIAQEMLDENRTGARGRRDWTYLLSGILECGICGHHYNGKKNRIGVRYYKCNAKISQGANGCTSKQIRANDLEQAITDSLREFISGIDRSKIDDVIDVYGSDNLAELRNSISKVRQEIEKLVNQSVAVLEKNLAGDITDVMFARMNQKLDARISEQQAILNSMTDKLSHAENDVTENKKIVDAVQQFLDIDIHAEKNRNVGKAILRELIHKIYVNEDGGIKIEWKFTPRVT